VTGFLGAAGLIGGAAPAAGHGFADGHKRLCDVGRTGVVFQTAARMVSFALSTIAVFISGV
jgi:hypothetical protein